MKKIITHSGSFHVDEIFAIALLARFYFGKPVLNLNIERTRDPQLLEGYTKDQNIFVIDLGGKYEPQNLNFDHHQKDPNLVWSVEKCKNLDQKLSLPYDKYKMIMQKLVNGLVPKSSCGLVWDFILENGNEEFNSLSQKVVSALEVIVQEIDLSDNGIYGWFETKTYSRFNRQKTNEFGETLNDEEYEQLQYSQFLKVLQMAEWYIDNFLALRKKAPLNEKKVLASIRHAKMNDHSEVLFFKNETFNAKILGNLYSSEAKLIAVYNEEIKKWSLKIVNREPSSLFSGRLKMPKKWAGLKDHELQMKSGFCFANFCHKDRFMMILNDCTKDECLDVCYQIIRISEMNSKK